MKLYTQTPPPKTIRLTFRKQGFNYEYIMIEYLPIKTVKENLKSIINKNLTVDLFSTQKRVAVDIREYEGSKVGKSESISFKHDVTPEQLKLIVLQNIEK